MFAFSTGTPTVLKNPMLAFLPIKIKIERGLQASTNMVLFGLHSVLKIWKYSVMLDNYDLQSRIPTSLKN